MLCFIEGGPEPLEKDTNEILGSKREYRFSNPFFELVQKTCQVRFWYLLRHGIACKGPQTLRRFPHRCQKTLARCQECAVNGFRPLIASTPDSSPPERRGLDRRPNITSQPWSHAICACTSASSTLSCRFLVLPQTKSVTKRK